MREKGCFLEIAHIWGGGVFLLSLLKIIRGNENTREPLGSHKGHLGRGNRTQKAEVGGGRDS